MKKVLLVIGIFVVAILVGYAILKSEMTTKNNQLDIINPTDIADKNMVDSTLLRKGYGHTVADFKFIDQFGDSITQEVTKGKVYVVDYFFTTCGSICPIMSNQMTRVQKEFLKEPNFVILSHTVWPEDDTVEQLANYGKKYGAVKDKWYFLTGDKEQLYGQARKSYFLLKPAEAGNVGDGNSDFIHTNNFVLIDQHKRIRGYYDGTNTEEVNHLIKDIHTLLGDN
ncbi:MAG: SCO family protein [Crocinitomicaceae bacterium]